MDNNQNKPYVIETQQFKNFIQQYKSDGSYAQPNNSVMEQKLVFDYNFTENNNPQLIGVLSQLSMKNLCELTEDFLHLQNKFQKIETELQQNKQQLLDSQSNEQKSKDQINNLNQTNQALEKIKNEIIQQLQENVKVLEEKISKKDLESVENLNKTITEQQNQINNLNQIVADLKNGSDNKKIEGLEQQIKILDDQISKHQIEQEKLNKFIPQKQLSEFGYDIIIQIKSLLELQNMDSNQVEVPIIEIQKINEEFNSALKNVIVVGFQGFKNKGKTFVLNSLINAIFLQDTILTPLNVAYVDSEGLGKAISMDYENNKHYQSFVEHKKDEDINADQSQQNLEDDIKNLDEDIKNRFYDIKATEQMQQDFIIQNSNILIIVISQLSLEDQILIQQISEKFIVDNNNKKQKKLIVVHNLQESRHPEEIKNYINELKTYFTIEEQETDAFEQQQQQQYNYVLYDEVKTHIVHVVMGNKDSKAGEYYNKQALDYIQKQINLYHELVHFNITTKLVNYLNKNLEKYISLSDEAKQPPLVEYKEESKKIVLKNGSLQIKQQDNKYGYLLQQSQSNIKSC